MKLEDIKNFQTPSWVMDLMIKEIPEDVYHILEPTKGAGFFVDRLLDENYVVTAPDGDYFEYTHKSRYCCVVGNPPFSPMVKGYEILFDVTNHSDNIVMLMPWLLLINSQKRLEKVMQFGLRKIIHLPRKAFPGTRVQTCVVVMKRGFIGDTIFSYVKE